MDDPDLGQQQVGGPVAVVTGSTSGIGRSIATMLSRELGFRVVLNSRNSVTAGAALARGFDEARYVCADVSDEQDAVRLIDTALREFGRLDVLVNNVGRTIQVPHRELTRIDQAAFAGLLDSNLLSAWNTVRAARDALLDSRGCVVNVSSVAGLRPRGSSIPYAVSKAALNHLTRLLARALAPELRVNAIAAGVIDTPLVREMPAMRDEWLASVPLRRMGDVEEVAAACRYLVTARYMTGAVLVLDGGMHLV